MSLRSPSLHRLLPLLLLFLLLPVHAQQNFQGRYRNAGRVGFDSFFRTRQWTPVHVELNNNGESIKGRLVIRPETSGTVVGNAFSTVIDLPNGAQKTATLYIQRVLSPRPFASN